MSDSKSYQANYCSDFNLTSRLINPGRCLMSAPLTNEICTGIQSCKLGVLLTMIDVAGSDPVLATWNPDWTATQDMSVNTMKPLVKGPIIVDAQLLRRGNKIISVTADIYDGYGVEDLDELKESIDSCAAPGVAPSLSAKGLAIFTRIPRTGAIGVDTYDPNNWLGVVKKRHAERYNSNSLSDRIGLTVLDSAEGVVTIANLSYVANSIGTINGGAQAAIAETAAEAMRPGMIPVDMQIHFLSQLKVGPVKTAGTIIRDARDHSVVMIQLQDAGANNSVLSTATLTLQRF